MTEVARESNQNKEEEMARQAYDTDLTDTQWALIAAFFPEQFAGKRGRPRKHTRREIVNAILYILTAGCVWRLLPHDLPPWKTVYDYFRTWSNDGTWEQITTTLRERVRKNAGRKAEPSAGSIDSQSVKTTEIGGERGFDGGKNIKGRKRHIVVDTMGLLLAVVVTAASVQDRDGAKLVFKKVKAQFSRLRLLWADGAYKGPLIDWVKEHCGWVLQIVTRPEGTKGFVLLARRWVVERTFGWLNSSRRLSKDYEFLPEHSEAFIHVAMIRLMVKRLARA